MVIHIYRNRWKNFDKRSNRRQKILRYTVKMVAKQSTVDYYEVDSIARCLRRNAPLSPGIARSLYSNTTSDVQRTYVHMLRRADV